MVAQTCTHSFIHCLQGLYTVCLQCERVVPKLSEPYWELEHGFWLIVELFLEMHAGLPYIYSEWTYAPATSPKIYFLASYRKL